MDRPHTDPRFQQDNQQTHLELGWYFLREAACVCARGALREILRGDQVKIKGEGSVAGKRIPGHRRTGDVRP